MCFQTIVSFSDIVDVLNALVNMYEFLFPQNASRWHNKLIGQSDHRNFLYGSSCCSCCSQCKSKRLAMVMLWLVRPCDALDYVVVIVRNQY